MLPEREWLERWKRVKERTQCAVNLNTYFEEAGIAGRQLVVMDIGPCSLPSGKILVRDPLVYLGKRDNEPYFLSAPPGTYRTEVCVIKPEDDTDCARYAAVRLRFTERPSIRFLEALIGHEDLDSLKDGEYFGFNADAGLGCICDEMLHKSFCDFSERWEKGHPDGNLYDDYFSALFSENYKTNPRFQRKGGDWLNWQIPGTEYHMPLFQSGFGDGTYPVYWGFDRDGAVCQIVVQLINIQLAYGEE